MTLLQIYGLTSIIVLGLMAALWAVSFVLKDASIVDIFWGTGYVIAGWLYFAFTPGGFLTRKWILMGLVTVWGLRLSFYIAWRNWGNGEDFRYRKWREQAGANWRWQSLFKVFLLQGLLLLIISTPLLTAQASATPDALTILDYGGIAVWAVGFFFEAVADWQMARFKANPANEGRVNQFGLWRYSRHPNYFGEALIWWAYFLIAAAGHPWTIFSPVLMTFLLLRISGVTLLEKTLIETKSNYAQYIEKTSAFFPWRPRK